MNRFLLFSCILLFLPLYGTLIPPEGTFLPPANGYPLAAAQEQRIDAQNAEEISRVNTLLQQRAATPPWNDYVTEGVHTPR